MFTISQDPINMTELADGLDHPAGGAFVEFEGRVRNHNEGQSVTALDYQAYKPLAEAEGNKIIEEAEKIQELPENRRPVAARKSRTFYSDAICFNACRTAEDVGASAIIGMTSSGYTAFKVSSYRPKLGSGIFIFSDHMHMLATLNLVWGVRCYHYDRFTTTDETMDDVTEILIKAGKIQPGDVIVNTGSMPIQKRHRTNMLKVSVVEERH